ncbi:MAG: hypothetical protein ABDH16_04635 [Thermodesulfovibrionaceae bacterium]
MRIEKIKFVQPYFKDLIIAVILLFISLIFYEKPVIEIREMHKINTVKEKVEKEKISQTKENTDFEMSKVLSIFKGERISEESEIKQPTFKEALFEGRYGRVKLVAITGTEKNKKAIVLDHLNNLRTLKKGEKIEDEVIVVNISDTSVKFKSGNKTKELSLYKKEDDIPLKMPRPRVTPLKPKQEEIIEEQETIEEEESPARVLKREKLR